MGSAMSLTCSKRKATIQDVGSSSNESCKRRKICSSSTNDDDDDHCRLVSDEFSFKHPWSFCANRVVNVAAALGFLTRFTQARLQQDDKDTEPSSLSLSTSLSQNRIHHVFPSFHGADVRKSILSHILESFKRKGIFPFNDNGIDRGNSIGPELIKAIRSSKIAIVLLSKNYASSSWCLNELAEIINGRERGQIVMPVFYEVDPSDIKKQAGDFGKAFKKTCKGRTKEDIDKWRKALEEVATIAGEHSHNWSNEAAMIEKVATDVLNKLTNSTPSKDLEYYVGMRTHMERMLSLLSLDSDEVRMIGIWGPPGIGKTTIARVLFHQLSSSFQLSTIMVDIKGCFPRLCFDEHDVQLQLQNRMLSQITNHKELKISHLGVAPELLKDKKVLLVIDEVDHRRQLDALAGTKSWFGSGSRIIVTTEDRSLLKAHDIDHIYKVKYPSSEEAFQIFCMHAFRQKLSPNDGLYELAVEASDLAGKLPLGLKVLGSALRGKSKEEWEMILPRLKSSLDGEIESIIKFSYDALCDEDKYLFLYLSCFFIYEPPLKVEEILASQFPNVKLGLHILTEKSLIFTNGYGGIEMHELVRQFGRETARKKLVRNGITKGELLVDERDICEVLTDDTTDNNRLIAISLKWKRIEEKLNISDKTLKKMADLQFIEIGDDWILSPSKLELQSLIFHSQKIRSLKWSFFGNICLPSTFNTEFLVNLELHDSKLEKLWEDNKVLKNLKWMKLSESRHLKELPDLSTATKLEELNLSYCSSLVELPDLSTATKLRKLNLQYCSSLVKFPSSFGNFNNLEEIDPSYCRCLVELPFYIGTATNLQKLDLTECSSLMKLPLSIGDLINLEKLNLWGCSSLVKLPLSIGDLINLEAINLGGCSSLVEIPFSIGNLQKLKTLNMDGCSKVEALPTNINLESLSHLYLTNCSQLKSFPEISTNIEAINLDGCSSLVEIPFSIGNLQKLKELKMDGCSKVEALPTNINLESLTTLNLTNCSLLKSFPEISTKVEQLYLTGTAINEIPWTIVLWPRLWQLSLNDCNNFVSLPQFPDSLRYLNASNCNSLERLDCSFNNPGIELLFSNCFKLNQEARDLIINTSCELAVLPGIEVPACFNYCRGTGGVIKWNESTHPTSLKFKVCTTLVKGKGDEETSKTLVKGEVDEETSDGEDESSDDSNWIERETIDIMVKQNDHIIPCRSVIKNIIIGSREHIHIFEVAFEVEAEEVTSTELVLELKTKDPRTRESKTSRMWKIGEWGIMKI